MHLSCFPAPDFRPLGPNDERGRVRPPIPRIGPLLREFREHPAEPARSKFDAEPTNGMSRLADSAQISALSEEVENLLDHNDHVSPNQDAEFEVVSSDSRAGYVSAADVCRYRIRGKHF